MRGTVPGLRSPHPLGRMLPSMYQDAEPLLPGQPDAPGDQKAPLVLRLCGQLDEVLAPILRTLDDLHAYVDPQLAPEDFLRWLASWVGVEDVVDACPLPRRRTVVAEMVALHAGRGTLAALQRVLELVTDAKVELWDNGETVWSDEPGAELAGSGPPKLWVRVVDGHDLDSLTIRALVEAWKPAHVPYELELVGA